MKTIIELRKIDVKRGSRCNGTGCPLALAAQRKFKRAARVTYSVITIGEWPEKILNFESSKRVKAFLTVFDSHGAAAVFRRYKQFPIRFQLTPL